MANKNLFSLPPTTNSWYEESSWKPVFKCILTFKTKKGLFLLAHNLLKLRTGLLTFIVKSHPKYGGVQFRETSTRSLLFSSPIQLPSSHTIIGSPFTRDRHRAYQILIHSLGSIREPEECKVGRCVAHTIYTGKKFGFFSLHLVVFAFYECSLHQKVIHGGDFEYVPSSLKF